MEKKILSSEQLEYNSIVPIHLCLYSKNYNFPPNIDIERMYIYTIHFRDNEWYVG